jgi:hypothetical protein
MGKLLYKPVSLPVSVLTGFWPGEGSRPGQSAERGHPEGQA